MARNRPSAPGLFALELTDAIAAITSQPDAGVAHATFGREIVRRVLLPTTEQHVYYTVDPIARVIIVHTTIWGARRGRRPKL